MLLPTSAGGCGDLLTWAEFPPLTLCKMSVSYFDWWSFVLKMWNAKVESRDNWSNRQIWPWSTKWSRANVNRALPREHICHSKHPLPTTQEKITDGHQQIVNNVIRLIINFAAKDGEALNSQQKQDWEQLYTVSKNKTGSWLWLRSWTHCQIQT